MVTAPRVPLALATAAFLALSACGGAGDDDDGDGGEVDSVVDEPSASNQGDSSRYGHTACRALVDPGVDGVLGAIARDAEEELGDVGWNKFRSEAEAIGRDASRAEETPIADTGQTIVQEASGGTFSPQDVYLALVELAAACNEADHITDTQVQQAIGDVGDDAGQAGDITDGVWTVGADVEPGTYRTTGEASSDCYWAITATGSNGSDIIANFIGGGRPVVVLEEGHDFETKRCGDWVAADMEQLRADADPATTMQAGIWTVGVDIAAGTYRPTNPASDDCYWAIHPGQGNTDDIIANGLAGGRPTVELSAGQEFVSNRCGTWQRED